MGGQHLQSMVKEGSRGKKKKKRKFLGEERGGQTSEVQAGGPARVKAWRQG